MSLVYITGIAGAGKSTICKELQRLGYEAHEGDDKLSAFYNNKTGDVVLRPRDAAARTPQWRAKHTWKMSRDSLLNLKKHSLEKPVFVCGVAENEEDCLDVFDQIFALDADLATIKKRITSRPSDGFGQNPHEMATILEWHKNNRQYFPKIGAIIIDTTKPLPQVIDDILENIR